MPMELCTFGRENLYKWTSQIGVHSLARRLLTTPDELMSWGLQLHPMWSQYLREMGAARNRVIRRRMRTELACALFADQRSLLKALALPLRFNDTYLPEYQSLIIEYSTRGVLRGEPLVSQTWHGVLPVAHHATLKTSLRRSRPAPAILPVHPYLELPHA